MHYNLQRMRKIGSTKKRRDRQKQRGARLRMHADRNAFHRSNRIPVGVGVTCVVCDARYCLVPKGLVRESSRLRQSKT